MLHSGSLSTFLGQSTITFFAHYIPFSDQFDTSVGENGEIQTQFINKKTEFVKLSLNFTILSSAYLIWKKYIEARFLSLLMVG